MPNTPTLENAKRWNPFVCSDCRAVFRVPADHEWRGVVCPACERMLRLPFIEDQLPPLVTQETTAPALKSESSEKIRPTYRAVGSITLEDEHTQKLKQRSRKTQIPAEQEWELDQSITKETTPAWLLALKYILSALAFITVVIVGYQAFKPKSNPTLPPAQNVATIAPKKISEKNHAPIIHLADFENVARSFLDAQNEAIMLTYCRPVPQLEEKIQAYYSEKPYIIEGLSEFTALEQDTQNRNVYYASVVTKQYETKRICLVTNEKNQPQVDWESWVGWSKVPLDKILTTRQNDSLQLRVIIEQEDYFNFDFPQGTENETKWSSYKLSSPDRNQVLHGYVAKNSMEAEEIKQILETGKNQIFVEVSYPENSTKLNQVIIQKVLSKSWVRK